VDSRLHRRTMGTHLRSRKLKMRLHWSIQPSNFILTRVRAHSKYLLG
jgi:hypothetical protein